MKPLSDALKENRQELDLSDLKARHTQHFEQPEQPPLEVIPAPQTWVNKTSKGFTGGIASGHGRRVSANDAGFAIEADPPLTAPEIALAQRNGFDVENGETGHLMLADKSEVRRVGGDINLVSRAVTSGRGR